MPSYCSLNCHETSSTIEIEGGRFVVEISKNHGLITRLAVGETEWVSTTEPVPDMWVSPDIDPRGNEFRARYESDADLRIEQNTSEQVVIEAKGRFYRITGDTLPMNWALRYEIHPDGICHISWQLRSVQTTALRWAVFNAGQFLIPSQAFMVFERSGDRAGFGLDTVVHDLASEPPRQLVHEEIRWFQLATTDASVDVVFPESDAAIGWTDTSPYREGDPLGKPIGAVDVITSTTGARWQRFSVRNTHQWIDPTGGLQEEFYLALQPVREHPAEQSLLSVYWEGPHQFVRGYSVPKVDQIAAWAEAGVQLVIGGVNWRSGDYMHPSDLAQTQRFIAACHRVGIKVVPYVTLHDLEYSTPVSPQYDLEWRIEPVVEFNYRSHLMCTGSDGWREHWKEGIARALSVLEVDGLYVDFWAGKLACTNERHGCGGGIGRYNAATVWSMLEFASRELNRRRGQSLIIANTNVLPLAMVNNWIDVRLVGEGRDIEQVPDLMRKAFYTPQRFGTSQLVLVDNIETVSDKTAALALATISALAVRRRDRPRRPEEIRAWEDYRECLFSLVGGKNPCLSTSTVRTMMALPEGVFVNIYQTSESVIFAFANLQPDAYEVGPELWAQWMDRIGIGLDLGTPIDQVREIFHASAVSDRPVESQDLLGKAPLSLAAQSWTVVKCHYPAMGNSAVRSV